MTKAEVQQILRDVCKENDYEPDREEKWHIYLATVDKLLKEDQITKAQHKSWTEVF